MPSTVKQKTKVVALWYETKSYGDTPQKMLWLWMAPLKWKWVSSLNHIRMIQFVCRSILSLSQLHISSLLLMSS